MNKILRFQLGMSNGPGRLYTTRPSLPVNGPWYGSPVNGTTSDTDHAGPRTLGQLARLARPVRPARMVG